MKVILLRDVAKIGRRHSIVEVPDGFALNRLIPKKDALPATPANLKSLKEKLGQTASHEAATVKQVAELATRLNEARLVISLKANEQGHLYEALSAGEVVKAAAAVGLSVDKSILMVPPHHKVVGECQLALQTMGQTFSFTVSIKSQ